MAPAPTPPAPTPTDHASALRACADAALARLAEAGAALDAPGAPPRAALERLALASDFAIDTLVRQPALLAALDGPPLPPPALAGLPDAEAGAALRRWRRAASTRLVWRDVQGLDDVAQTLAGSSAIAEQALAAALAHARHAMAERHGVVRDAAGAEQALVVFGLGKLGGGELNFSSDVDLVFAWSGQGAASDGPRPLDAEAWFARCGQRLIQLLDEVTAEGFSHRVDMRLRPFGSAGRLVLPFAAMEAYFQREGRDWERYAWIKARSVAGDLAAGEGLLADLRPFVYRRYLDFTALDSLREMKAGIAAEVARRDLVDHLKLGPGGIREVEFLAQALQLIRGGREPALRVRGLRAALAALAAAGHLPADTAARLGEAYDVLRRLENRVQMLADAQVHAVPADAFARARLAAGLGEAGWDAVQARLDAARGVVSAAFADLLAARRAAPASAALAHYWRALPDDGDAAALAEAGFAEAEAHDARLRDFARSPAVRGRSARTRDRLDHVLPALLEAAARSPRPDAALPRLLALLQAISKRTSYLALLEEQPAALRRLVDVTARSAFLAERLAQHPLLLDELLDQRAAGPVPDPASLAEAIARGARERAAQDPEQALQGLNELRHALSFRIALAVLAGRMDAGAAAAALAALAGEVLREAHAIAEAEVVRAHGRLPDGGLAVIGYGSLGGEELGIGSDLDLVFLHDAPADAASDGDRPLDAARWCARLAQKLLGLLGTPTAAGRLYEVDVRLRPDGAKGMLVSSLASFADYQRERAWTWERQALVRARPIAGDAKVCAAFERIRADTLRAPRDAVALREDVARMRARMRAELDRSRPGGIDLKQGEGGLVDLEFLLQHAVLRHAHAHPALVEPRASAALLRALGEAGLLEDADALARAHALLLARGLECTLDRRPRIAPGDEALAEARAVVRAAFVRAGLEAPPPPRECAAEGLPDAG